jgi:C-terminal processing protease CtpA/Prc
VIRPILAVAFLALSLSAQTPGTRRPIDPAAFAASMSFEAENVNGSPSGWGGGPPESIKVDDKVVHNGRWSVRLDRTIATSSPFSVITRTLPIDFAGKTIELRGFMKTENVTEFAGLWMREDGDTPTLQFDNMQNRQIKGTTEWTEYSIVLPIHPEARQLFFGFLVGGSGKAWADDLQLLVDGKPIWEAPAAQRPVTVLETDHQFDTGSGVLVSELTAVQIANVRLLGKVWGFLKYHHPQVTAGKFHWDYELFRVLPVVLRSANSASAQAAIAEWIGKLGEVSDCTSCATLDDTDLHLRPKLEWLSDTTLLGAELSRRLQAIHRNRPGTLRQFYVSFNPNVRNPSFDHELGYERLKLPDAGLQLLGLFRMWNIIEYWFPYRDVLSDNWDQVLLEFIPRIGLAKDAAAYQLELMALIAKIHDTHANLWSSIAVRPPAGACMSAVNIRFIGNDPVVTGFEQADTTSSIALRAGDVIESIDGVPVKTLVERWSRYYAASNDPTRLRDIARFMTRGECVDVALRVRRGTETIEAKAPRLPMAKLKPYHYHDLPGETFRKLSNDVAYVKLSSVKTAEAAKYVDGAAGTKGLIIDLRNYPSEFMVFSLGSLLVDKPTPFARFTAGDPANPGAFRWGAPIELTPQQPHYGGKVVILVDEVSQSSAEYTSMAFRASPRATVVGSTTAGADGNVSQLPLPGGLRSMISGIGVFYPDKRPTQRVGIVPDIVSTPTVEGIRSGRDEVLERGLRVILGADTPDAEIQKMARHQ